MKHFSLIFSELSKDQLTPGQARPRQLKTRYRNSNVSMKFNNKSKPQSTIRLWLHRLHPEL
jgi:hypothetical protein